MRTAKLMKSKKFKKTKSKKMHKSKNAKIKKIQKSKKMKGGSALPQLALPLSGKKRKDESGNLSQSYDEVCNTSRCVSCRYFAMKVSFLKMKYELKDMDELFEKYDRGALNSFATPFEPDELGQLPIVAAIFITKKEQPISSPLHAFMIRRILNTHTGQTQYKVDGSWAQSRAAKEQEWLNYVERQQGQQTEYVNWDELYIDEIAHPPTTQRPFLKKN